jgi:hypothetical protein
MVPAVSDPAGERPLRPAVHRTRRARRIGGGDDRARTPGGRQRGRRPVAARRFAGSTGGPHEFAFGRRRRGATAAAGADSQHARTTGRHRSELQPAAVLIPGCHRAPTRRLLVLRISADRIGIVYADRVNSFTDRVQLGTYRSLRRPGSRELALGGRAHDTGTSKCARRASRPLTAGAVTWRAHFSSRAC